MSVPSLVRRARVQLMELLNPVVLSKFITPTLREGEQNVIRCRKLLRTLNRESFGDAALPTYVWEQFRTAGSTSHPL